MSVPKYSDSVKRWEQAQLRIEAAEKKISDAFLDSFFRRHSNGNPPSRPCANVTPPKQPPKK